MLRVAGLHQTETQVLTISLSTEPFDYNDHIILSCFYNVFMQICKAITIKKDEKWWVWWWFYFFINLQSTRGQNPCQQNRWAVDWTAWAGLRTGSEVRGARSWLSWMQGQHRHLEVTSCPLSLTGHCWQLSPADQRHKQLLGRETDVRLH